MKKVILIFAMLLAFGCSPDDSGSIKEIPNTFDIRVEIKGAEGIYFPEVYIYVPVSGKVKEWRNETLPFTGEYTYVVTGNEIPNTGCKCITISVSAYISELEEFNLYIDGVLVATRSTIAPNHYDGTMNPTRLDYVFTP